MLTDCRSSLLLVLQCSQRAREGGASSFTSSGLLFNKRGVGKKRGFKRKRKAKREGEERGNTEKSRNSGAEAPPDQWSAPWNPLALSGPGRGDHVGQTED